MKKVDGLYVYKHKPSRCKVCGSKNIAELLWGLPDFNEKLQQKIDQQEIILMGCSRELDNNLEKSWQCNDCSEFFYFDLAFDD